MKEEQGFGSMIPILPASIIIAAGLQRNREPMGGSFYLDRASGYRDD